MWEACRGSRARVSILRLAGAAILGLRGLGHGCFQERFVVSSRFDELLVELRKFIYIAVSQWNIGEI